MKNGNILLVYKYSYGLLEKGETVMCYEYCKENIW